MSTTPLRERYARPDWVKRINAMGESVLGAERLVPLDADALVEAARAATGLDDFGDVDGDWRARLGALVEALEDTARLHTLGRLMTRQEILRCLVARLLLAKRRADEPAVARERIAAPIVIAGPARSGTSILQELLWLDPNARCPLARESLHPVPPASLQDPEAQRRVAECEQELWADVQPEFAAVHELAAHLPMECIAIQQPSFGGYHWPMVADIPGFPLDFPAAMAYHRAALQALQHGEPPKTWVLKTPVYLLMLDLLLETYPDAHVVVTHRDPAKTAPSSLSTLATVRWLRSDAVDLDAMDGYASGLLLLMLTERSKSGTLPARTYDLLFADLMQDPVAALERLYDAMGRPFLPEHADAVRTYLARKPKGKHGAHRYTAADWGLDERRIREQLAPYVEHYGVPLER